GTLVGFVVEDAGPGTLGRTLAGGRTLVPVYGVSRCRGKKERWWQQVGSPCSLICGVLIGFALYSKKEEPGIELI
ncbi:MAG: hypothetical protein WB696_19700, partial [Chthoniobacterales bacterium]